MTAPFRLTQRIAHNAAGARATAAPKLSVLIPYLRYDVAPLVRALTRKAWGLPVELVLLDDGANIAGQTAATLAAIEATSIPATLIISAKNLGRAKGRNRLIAAARGRHVLFLDADMMPDSDTFLARWLDLIDWRDPGVAFGGFSVNQTPDAPETALHKAASRAADCRPARSRARAPAQSLTTSNLLVRRDVLAAVAFDETFEGWGYEDVEWALRASAIAEIVHVDIPATHMGLDAPAMLVRKAAEGGANYARLAARHTDAVKGFSSYRAAAALRKALDEKSRARVRRFAAGLVEDRHGLAPMPARRLALKVLRAAHLAECLP